MKKVLKRFFILAGAVYLIFAAIPFTFYAAAGGFQSPLPAVTPTASPPPESPSLPESSSAKEPESSGDPAPTAAPTPIQGESAEGLSFTIKDTATDETKAVSERDFLISTIGLEMSPTAPEEALKAQAVAARSFYRRLSENEDYNFTYDSSGPYIYAENTYFEDKWGESFEEYRKLIETAVDSTADEIVTYNDEIACTSFFAMSNGKTQSAEETWGQDLPYLTNVASPYDALSPEYEKTVTFTPEEIKTTVENRWPDGKFDFTLPYDEWFSDVEYNAGGSVYSTNICGFTVTGNEVRSAFLLRSTTYAIEYDGENFVFKTRGYGHGVGMSQTGAIAMAADGASYTDILSWYYPGTEIRS